MACFIEHFRRAVDNTVNWEEDQRYNDALRHSLHYFLEKMICSIGYSKPYLLISFRCFLM
jgi:hypothetical protein